MAEIRIRAWDEGTARCDQCSRKTDELFVVTTTNRKPRLCDGCMYGLAQEASDWKYNRELQRVYGNV